MGSKILKQLRSTSAVPIIATKAMVAIFFVLLTSLNASASGYYRSPCESVAVNLEDKNEQLALCLRNELKSSKSAASQKREACQTESVSRLNAQRNFEECRLKNERGGE